MLLLLVLLQGTLVGATRVIGLVTMDPSSPEWTLNDSFVSAILSTHNTYREEHDAGKLRWNGTLAAYSEDYLASNGDEPGVCPAWEHSDTPYGENLAIGHCSATAAVEAWGDERDIYDFDDQGFSKGTGHFTQLIWQDTTDVGCARKWCDGIPHPDSDVTLSRWYLVCEYWPPGNVMGQFEDQVKIGEYDGPGEEKGEGKGEGDDESTASLIRGRPNLFLAVLLSGFLGYSVMV
ncbi:PR-1-like protein [Sodiomyces alkalinus F11]|uniref:PR-1-like protein n=1 Tax=Sodiomyces alkalinus (strain CBS 110278 / VKM F-3762 / F11) TaxID=1314773 RepID=A0A3N2PWY4_SODAK|nr:PR-1-like protein [Sodiomyces alkalinus F11]ROT39030.1 PR-1-like protein [Sodiomyces alkalinus F11]